MRSVHIGFGLFSPQLKGFGHSYRLQYYGIADGNEECAYLAHPLLNAWLREITNVILHHSVKEVKEVMGSRIDALKFCYSMTLFDAVCPNDIF